MGIDNRAALPSGKIADWISGREDCPRPVSAPCFRRWQNKSLPEIEEAPRDLFAARPRTAMVKANSQQLGGRGRAPRATLAKRDLVGKKRTSVWFGQVAQEDEDVMSKTIQFGLHMRKQDDTGIVLDILKEAMGTDRQGDFRAFTPPYHPNRKQFVAPTDDATMMKKVLRAMKREGGSFGSVNDLLQCTPQQWVNMGNLLEGCSLGTVKRCALDHLERATTPLDRAASQVSLAWRNPIREQGRKYRVTHWPFHGEKYSVEIRDEQYQAGAFAGPGLDLSGCESPDHGRHPLTQAPPNGPRMMKFNLNKQP